MYGYDLSTVLHEDIKAYEPYATSLRFWSVNILERLSRMADFQHYSGVTVHDLAEKIHNAWLDRTADEDEDKRLDVGDLDEMLGWLRYNVDSVSEG